MHRLTRFLRGTLVFCFFIMLNTTLCFANQGQGHGNGQGQGHGNGQGQGHGNGQGQGHGNGQGQGHRNAHMGNSQGQGHSQAKHHEFQTNAKMQKQNGNAFGFSRQNRSDLNNYFKAHPFTNSTLPPGIAKNVARGKPLPPGIAKVFLPAEATDLLPKHPGYDYLVVDKDVVLVNSTTGIVSNIIKNVLP